MLYCAVDGTTCMAEVFQQTRRIDRVRDAPWLAVFELRQPLRLLDLRRGLCHPVGASMAINTGSRVRAREWAQRFYEAFDDLQGIYYASSMHANQGAIALNERALHAVAEHPMFNRALADDACWMFSSMPRWHWATACADRRFGGAAPRLPASLLGTSRSAPDQQDHRGAGTQRGHQPVRDRPPPACIARRNPVGRQRAQHGVVLQGRVRGRECT